MYNNIVCMYVFDGTDETRNVLANQCSSESQQTLPTDHAQEMQQVGPLLQAMPAHHPQEGPE